MRQLSDVCPRYSYLPEFARRDCSLSPPLPALARLPRAGLLVKPPLDNRRQGQAGRRPGALRNQRQSQLPSGSYYCNNRITCNLTKEVVVKNIVNPVAVLIFTISFGLTYGLGKRSEERRVGKECRSR